MGLAYLEIDVGNPADPDTTERVQFLIDSGAVYSVVPTPVLEGLGIRPLSEQQFRLANGTTMTRKRGIALFRYEERVGAQMSSSAKRGDSNLLGATTLESLGLILDPLKRELRPLPMVL